MGGGRTWKFDCISPTKNYSGCQRFFLLGFRCRLKSPSVFIMTLPKNRSQALAAREKKTSGIQGNWELIIP